MKKLNLMALAAAAVALASCSQSDDIAGQSAENIADGLVPIQLNVSNPYAASMTRGTGVVGGLTDDDNIWKGEAVNIYMLKKGTMEYAYFTEGTADAIYNDAQFDTPAEAVNTASGLATASDGSIKYYPPSGNFDFWGYRLDDCRLGQKIETAESIVIPFTLDGSQDIMVGKAVPTAEQQANATQQVLDRSYSAYAARNGVQPDITFKHLLTRLTFQAQAKTASVCDQEQGVYIDAVRVKTVAGGELTVAYTDAAGISSYDQQIKFTGDSVYLYLKDRATASNTPLPELQSVLPTWNMTENQGDKVRIGESLMIPAGEKYELLFYVHQSKPKSNGGTPERVDYVLPYTLTTTTDFQMGYSYNVLLTINGLEQINITATLEKWGDGGTISINPEDDM